MYEYTFTIFTPTFNRKKELKYVYNALLKQTYKNFEWLIVDDGSEDNTSTMVYKWIKENKINIRYIYKINGGKHTAYNKGVLAAKGEFFLVLDSDDTCKKDALEQFLYYWEDIPIQKRDNFSGITCLCENKEGKIIGDMFEHNIVDDYPLKVMPYLKGEKWGFHRTDILKKFLFPEFEGERFVPESLIWNRISLKYKVRHINIPLRIYEALDSGLSSNSVLIRKKSPNSTKLFYTEAIALPVKYKYIFKSAANLFRFSLHGQYTADAWRVLAKKPSLYLAIIVGIFLYLQDIKRYNEK